jgi:predicted O-methyltransferase YrrM
MASQLKHHLGRVARIPSRLRLGMSYFAPALRRLAVWSLRSREDTNLTYDLTADNLEYLAHSIAVVTGCEHAMARRYIDEARDDRGLHEYVSTRIAQSATRHRSDPDVHFGRRLGWYAMVRLLGPEVVVETGVDKGHGAVVLCAALLRNAAEGNPGRYFGLDIDPAAGWLLGPPYDSTGTILYGDAIETLQKFAQPIDLFINDSSHSAEYEYREYRTITPRLRPGAVILGDNAHVSAKLADYSRETGRRFLFFKEVPREHWYPGAGIGISFTGPASR